MNIERKAREEGDCGPEVITFTGALYLDQNSDPEKELTDDKKIINFFKPLIERKVFHYILDLTQVPNLSPFILTEIIFLRHLCWRQHGSVQVAVSKDKITSKAVQASGLERFCEVGFSVQSLLGLVDNKKE